MSEVHVYDTFAVANNGRILHFDVVLNRKDSDHALSCAREWLGSIGQGDAHVDLRSCCFCHSTPDAPASLLEAIEQSGFAIIRLEGCPPAA